jgi:hypothetical protein
MVFEDIRRPATRFIADSPIGLRPDDDVSRTSVLAPAIDASKERFILPEGKSAQTVRSAWIRMLADERIELSNQSG